MTATTKRSTKTTPSTSPKAVKPIAETPKTETKEAAKPVEAKREFLINSVKVTDDTPIKYASNPKRVNSQAHQRYEAYQAAKTIAEYFELNKTKAAMADLRHDQMKGFLTINPDS